MDSNLRVRAAIPIKKMQFDDIINGRKSRKDQSSGATRQGISRTINI
jgi:hypothetical protein